MIKMRRDACILLGAAGMYFLDPSLGERRRSMALDKVRSLLADRQRRVRRDAVEEAHGRGELASVRREPSPELEDEVMVAGGNVQPRRA